MLWGHAVESRLRYLVHDFHAAAGWGFTVRFVDADDFDGLRAAINEKTRAVYMERLGRSWMWWTLSGWRDCA